VNLKCHKRDLKRERENLRDTGLRGAMVVQVMTVGLRGSDNGTNKRD
jgi:hypothetical protein